MHVCVGDLAAPGRLEQLGSRCCLEGDRRRLGTSGGCPPVSLWWSVSVFLCQARSPPAPCVSISTCLCLSFSLSPSLLSSLLSLPPWKAPPEPGETGPEVPQGRNRAISVQAGLPWQPRGAASAPSWGGGPARDRERAGWG